jgi:transcriptional regulator with XRE-family HTH domain
MFAHCLRSLRQKAGISQYQLAKQSGVSKQMLSRLELGTRQPSWETVQRLANALGVDCRSFVDPDLTMPVAYRAQTSRGHSMPSYWAGGRGMAAPIHIGWPDRLRAGPFFSMATTSTAQVDSAP